MIGLINRIGFAPTDVVDGAEAVPEPSSRFADRDRARSREEALSKSFDPDPLLAFSSICRADLDNVHRTVV